MDWEQKLMALKALAKCQLVMRGPGDWYVSQRVDVKNGSVLEGRYGSGRTPQGAVEDHWKQLTELADHEYVIIDAYGTNRKAVRWNGFMWDRVEEKRPAPC